MANKFLQGKTDAGGFSSENMTAFIPQTAIKLSEMRDSSALNEIVHIASTECDIEAHYFADIADSDITAKMIDDAVADETTSDVAIERLGALACAKLYAQEIAYDLPSTSENFRGARFTKERLSQCARIIESRKAIPTAKLEFSGESFLSNLRYRVGKFGMNMATIKLRFDEAVKVFEEHGPSEKQINNPAYAKWLSLGYQKNDPQAVIAGARKMLVKYDLSGAKKLLQEITASYIALAKVYEDNSISASKHRLDMVRKHAEKVGEVCRRFQEHYEELPEVSTVADPADQKAVTDAIALFRTHYCVNDIRDIELEIEHAYNAFNSKVRSQVIRDSAMLAAMHSEYNGDASAASGFILNATRYAECAFKVFRANQHTLNALAYYIADSTR